MSEWKQRLTRNLEPILKLTDPRKAISAYDNMPYAIFHYPPEEELAARREFALLATRLERDGKRVTRISLSECLAKVLESQRLTLQQISGAELSAGIPKMLETLCTILGSDASGVGAFTTEITSRLPKDGDPTRDLFFMVRAGSLFPFYRTSAICEQLMGTTELPGVLFYPGTFDGVTGLSFMGAHDPEANYRPKIF